jgi:hypothetical protein
VTLTMTSPAMASTPLAVFDKPDMS